jgi:hypothetical protein
MMSKETELLKRVRDALLGLKETHYDLYWDIQTALDHPSLDLRDHFAGLAMQSLIAGGKGEKWWDEKDFAWNAYRQADAMLAEREKK